MLNRALEHAFEIMDHVWTDIAMKSTAVDFTNPVDLANIRVPKAPDGYVVLVEGWCNLEWDNATALDVDINIEVGTTCISTNRLLTEATALAISMAAKAIYAIDTDATFRLVMRHNAGRTSITANSRGIIGRYIVNKGG